MDFEMIYINVHCGYEVGYAFWEKLAALTIWGSCNGFLVSVAFGRWHLAWRVLIWGKGFGWRWYCLKWGWVSNLVLCWLIIPLLLIIHKDCCISFFVVLGAYTNFNRNCSLNNETALVVVYVNFFALKIEMCFTWLSDLMLHVVSSSLFSFCFNLCDSLVCMYGWQFFF